MSIPPWQIVRMIETKNICHSGKRALPKTVCIGPFRHSPCGGNAVSGAGANGNLALAKENKWNGQLTKNPGSSMMD
jgi:hypothetical protein